MRKKISNALCYLTAKLIVSASDQFPRKPAEFSALGNEQLSGDNERGKEKFQYDLESRSLSLIASFPSISLRSCYVHFRRRWKFRPFRFESEFFAFPLHENRRLLSDICSRVRVKRFSDSGRRRKSVFSPIESVYFVLFPYVIFNWRQRFFNCILTNDSLPELMHVKNFMYLSNLTF